LYFLFSAVDGNTIRTGPERTRCRNRCSPDCIEISTPTSLILYSAGFNLWDVILPGLQTFYREVLFLALGCKSDLASPSEGQKARQVYAKLWILFAPGRYFFGTGRFLWRNKRPLKAPFHLPGLVERVEIQPSRLRWENLSPGLVICWPHAVSELVSPCLKLVMCWLDRGITFGRAKNPKLCRQVELSVVES